MRRHQGRYLWRIRNWYTVAKNFDRCDMCRYVLSKSLKGNVFDICRKMKADGITPHGTWYDRTCINFRKKSLAQELGWEQ
jgi:hypothetical protein